jgi:hypothetical protein
MVVDADVIDVVRGSERLREGAAKCVDPNRGTTVFFLTQSAAVTEGDVLAWKGSEEWVVMQTNNLSAGIRCEVRKRLPGDRDIDELLRHYHLSETADYLENARERLLAGSSAALGDCKTSCRNALLAAVKGLSGKGSFNDGVRALHDTLGLGEREQEYLRALERLLLKSKDLLSKAGPHPPLPGPVSAHFAMELTTATLKFLVLARESGPA